jgi:hypothetical protein
MTKRPEYVEERQGNFSFLLSAAGDLVVLAGAIAQLVLIVVVLDYHHAYPQGGMAGMGIVGMILLSLFLVVPATLIAVVKDVYAIGRYRRGARAGKAIVLYTIGALLPLVLFLVIQWTDAAMRR